MIWVAGPVAPDVHFLKDHPFLVREAISHLVDYFCPIAKQWDNIRLLARESQVLNVSTAFSFRPRLGLSKF
jgi:hypothetical protein